MYPQYNYTHFEQDSPRETLPYLIYRQLLFVEGDNMITELVGKKFCLTLQKKIHAVTGQYKLHVTKIYRRSGQVTATILNRRAGQGRL